MSHNARIEEVSDSDPDDMDPNDFDPDDLPTNQVLQQINPPRASAPAPQIPQQAPLPTPQAPRNIAKQEVPKHWQCLYPVYFDKTRSRKEGRRVGKHLAIENPLAYNIVLAVSRLGLGLEIGFEPDKLHPKDWANPGRVRILLKEDGELVQGNGPVKVNNKQHLYDLVGEYLIRNPTTKEAPLQLKLHGFPNPPEPLKRTEVPRGWKVGTILPSHSSANTWGGVSNNPLQDAMKEMQGQPGFPMIPGMGMDAAPSAPEPKKKKDKKKGKA